MSDLTTLARQLDQASKWAWSVLREDHDLAHLQRIARLKAELDTLRRLMEEVEL